MTQVSVALCMHNGAAFIREQIRSICHQTFVPSEIVISDDASTDGGLEIASETLRACERQNANRRIEVNILRNPQPLGVTRNFQQAVTHCRGDLVVLCDQDDAWHPHRLDRLRSEFERRPELLLLHSDARLVDAGNRSLGGSLFHALEVQPSELACIHEGRAFDALLHRNLVTGATAVFRRSLLAHALPFPEEWLHDEWLAIIAAAVGRVDVLEEPLIDYRQHAGNQLGARRESFLQKMQRALMPPGNSPTQPTVKAEQLLARMLKLVAEVDVEKIGLVFHKLEHQRFRARLPNNRLARILPIAHEALKGHYARVGRGGKGIVRDFLQPR